MTQIVKQRLLKEELELEKKFAFLLNGNSKNISSHFETPKHISKIAANHKRFGSKNDFPSRFIDIDDYITKFVEYLDHSVSPHDIEIYVADRVWDFKLFAGEILTPHWALLAAARHSRRHDRGSFHEAISGLYKGFQEIGLLEVAKDMRRLTDDLVQRTENIAIAKYETMIGLLDRAKNTQDYYLKGFNND